jgi:hypothetical protein
MFAMFPALTARLRATLCVLVAAAAAGCATTAGPPATLPIAAARELALGAQVTVEGVVTVRAGTFDAGFALQDATGGIYVTRAGAIAPEIGERLRVDGRAVAPHSQAGIEPAAFVALGIAQPPAPLETATGAVGAATEGRLVAVRGRVTGDVIDDQPWGWKLYLDDGSGPLLIFIATGTHIDARGLRAGQELRIVGFSGRYEQHTEVLPRGPGDISR